MMLTPIKKDLRVFLVPTIGGLVLISCGFLISTAAFELASNARGPDLHDVLAFATIVGMLMVVLLAAAYGGSAFTVERREHSSDWLNILPITRGEIITSKVIAAVLCIAALGIYDILPIVVIYMKYIPEIRGYQFDKLPWILA